MRPSTLLTLHVLFFLLSPLAVQGLAAKFFAGVAEADPLARAYNMSGGGASLPVAVTAADSLADCDALRAAEERAIASCGQVRPLARRTFAAA